jgi:hypothetical protein
MAVNHERSRFSKMDMAARELAAVVARDFTNRGIWY